jgi:hypothetical protein
VFKEEVEVEIVEEVVAGVEEEEAVVDGKPEVNNNISISNSLLDAITLTVL